MPAHRTPHVSPYQRIMRPAAGFHYKDKKRVILFHDFVDADDRPQQALSVGRSKACDIQVTHRLTSRKHATLERLSNGHTQIAPTDPTNALYVDGQPITEPVLLTVGMRVRLGRAVLIACDGNGRFPFAADTADNFLRGADEHYGSNQLAGERIGRSRETIRQRRLPERLRRRKP